MLIMQIASYGSYIENFPSTYGYSGNVKPEDLIGKGFTYDVSVQLNINDESYLTKERISSAVSKYNAQTNEFTLHTTITGDYAGQKEMTTHETVINHNPFSNAEISRQYWMSSIIDSFNRTSWKVEIHDTNVKPVGPIVIEFQGSRYIGIMYETEGTIDLTYPAYIPTKLSLKIEEKDRVFPDSGLIYQADANLSGSQEGFSISIKYHASLVKTDIAAGHPIATQVLNHETLTISDANNSYSIILLHGDDMTITSKDIRLKEGYASLNYETRQYAKEAIVTISLPNQLMKDSNLSFSSLKVEVDEGEHSDFSLTSSDPDTFINVRDLSLGQHRIKFSFTGKLDEVKPVPEIVTEEQTKGITKYQQLRDIMIKAPVQINVVMLGTDWSDTTEIEKQLPKSYKPMILSQNKTIGVEFIYNYNFVNTAPSTAEELFSLIDSLAIDNSKDIPVSIIEWLDAKYKAFEVVRYPQGYFYMQCVKTEKECKSQLPYGVDTTAICLYDVCGLYKLNYKWIDATLVEEWLHDKGLTSEGYTIFFLRPPTNHLKYLHTYGMITTDADSDKTFRQEGMMGFGGKYRFYFVDLTAGPSFYPQVPIPTIATVFHKNIFDTASDQDLENLLAYYIKDAVTLLFTPSYIYEPTYKPNYFMDIFIIDQTSGRSFATIAPQYLTSSKLESAMKSLIPYSEWKFKIEGKSFDWLPRELGRSIIKSMSFDTFNNIDTIRIDSATLQTELGKWKKSTLTPEKAQELESEKGTAVYLPVFILVFDAFAYVDDGALGVAVEDVDDPKVPCCVIIATEKARLTDFDVGLTSITVHEAGHLVGLLHPHDGYREDVKGGWFQNWFFDWSSTPMTYASPIAFGCGGLIQDESGIWRWKECGMSISDYNQFNYDAVDRGLILHQLGQTITNINMILEILQTKGYGDNTPSDIESVLLALDEDIHNIEQQFSKLNYFSRSTVAKADSTDNALDLSFRALKNSQVLLQQADQLQPFVQKQEEPEKPQPPISEPSVTEKPSEGHDISVAMKLKKKSTLLAIKNTGDTEIFSVKIKASDGNVRYVKAKGWDREKIDASTVIVRTSDKPLIEGKSLLVILVIDNKGSGIEWTALDAKAAILSSGALIPK